MPPSRDPRQLAAQIYLGNCGSHVCSLTLTALIASNLSSLITVDSNSSKHTSNIQLAHNNRQMLS